jgi:hypothetical protein
VAFVSDLRSKALGVRWISRGVAAGRKATNPLSPEPRGLLALLGDKTPVPPKYTKK